MFWFRASWGEYFFSLKRKIFQKEKEMKIKFFVLFLFLVTLPETLSIGDCGGFVPDLWKHVPLAYCPEEVVKGEEATSCLEQPPAWQGPDAVLKQFYVWPTSVLYQDIGQLEITLFHPIHEHQANLICPQLDTDSYNEEAVRCTVQEPLITCNWIGSDYDASEGRFSTPTRVPMWDNPRVKTTCTPLSDPFYSCTACEDTFVFSNDELIETGPFERYFVGSENRLRVEVELNVCEVYKSATELLYWGSECPFHYLAYVDFYRPDGQSEWIFSATYTPKTYTDTDFYGRLFLDISIPKEYEIEGLEAEYGAVSDPLKFFNENNDFYDNNALMYFKSERRVPELSEGGFQVTIRYKEKGSELPATQEIKFFPTYRLQSFQTTKNFEYDMEIYLGDEPGEIITNPKTVMMRGETFYVVLYLPTSSNTKWEWGTGLPEPEVLMQKGGDLEKVVDGYKFTDESENPQVVEELRASGLKIDDYLFKIYSFTTGQGYDLWKGYRTLFKAENNVVPKKELFVGGNVPIPENVDQKLMGRKTIECYDCSD